MCGADDFDATTAAAYGWINRALPDADLDDFVDNLAKRIATFDRPALELPKRMINSRGHYAKGERALVLDAVVLVHHDLACNPGAFRQVARAASVNAGH